MPDSKIYEVLGLMSGSSLDGLDIAYCKINSSDTYSFEIISAKTFSYSDDIKNWLRNIPVNLQKDYSEESKYFGNICGEFVNEFVSGNKIKKIDFIASHGHTIFHFPEKKITCQIGDGKIISQKTNCNVIYNFRQKDIDAGGQGAPLVPVCDELFFNNYHSCLNIGGIANISFINNGVRIGFDICAANQLLNYCAAELNMEFDEDGNIAKSGTIDKILFEELNKNNYFDKPFPKSLDNNWITNHFISLLNQNKISTADKLATVTEHVAFQISKIITAQIHQNKIPETDYKILITGGGALNKYLIERIEKLSGIKIIIPDLKLIQFKEALAMCLMGVLRWENKNNFLPSVTGAKYVVSGGEIAYI